MASKSLSHPAPPLAKLEAKLEAGGEAESLRPEVQPTSTPSAAWRRLLALLTWTPLVLLMLGLIAAGVWHELSVYRSAGRLVKGTVTVDTDGASAQVNGSVVALRVPLAVYNGLDTELRNVSLWVDLYACPDDEVGLADCRRLFSGALSKAMDLAAGGTLIDEVSVDVVIPTDVGFRRMRVRRKLEQVVSHDDEVSEARGRSIEQKAEAAAGSPL